jgi:hypothetical protein
VIRRLRHGPTAPVAVAGILSVPLFLSALMAVSLAVEKPRVTTVVRHGRMRTVEHVPTDAVEARIWLLALVAPLAIILVGVLARALRAGVYPPALAAIVAPLVVTHRLDAWVVRHAHRFPLGVDRVRDSSNSNTLSRGEWEASAKQAALNLAHWTMALAAAAVVIAVVVEVRRRRKAAVVAAGPPAEPSVHAPTTTLPPV